MNFLKSWLIFLLIACFCAWLLPRARYRTIVIHHTASQSDSLASIRRAHGARGWYDIGYHLVLANGQAGVPAGHLEVGARYRWGGYSVATRNKWCNVTALHLTLVGNYENAPFPRHLQPALANAVRTLCRRYGIDPANIHLHRDCSATACPGRHIDRDAIQRWLKTDPEAVPQALAAQHERALRQTLVAPLPIGLSVFGLEIALWSIVRRWRKRRRSERDEPVQSGGPQRGDIE